MKVSDELFIKIVSNSCSVRQVIKELGLVPAGGNYDTVNRRIINLGLDITHFTGKASNKGKPRTWGPEAKPLQELLVFGKQVKSDVLKKRLLKEGIKRHQCEQCLLEEWLGVSIPLELEHCDGNKDNNLLKNLKVLCPNCHALTPTYRGKNIGNKANSKLG